MFEHVWYLLKKRPLLYPVVAGLVARLVAAWCALGFFARDDYFHVLEPALRWLADPHFDWDRSDVPGAGIRSHLFPRVVWLILKTTSGFGITDPETSLSVVYSVVGLFSLAIVPGTYVLARRLLSERGTLLATWLASLHFAMPYVGTRLLIEALAMVPIVWSFYFLTFPSVRALFTAGVFLGLGCWFRYQVIAVAPGIVVAMVIGHGKNGAIGKTIKLVVAVAMGGIVAIVAQGLFDLWTTGQFLGPLFKNVAVNANPPAELSRSSPITYLGLWLLLTAPPATVLVLPGMWNAGKRLILLSAPFASFVLVHSFVPHKEDRFMLPVLPLFLVLLAAVPEELATSSSKWLTKLARWQKPMTYWFGLSHALFLLLAITGRSQLNIQQAMHHLHSDKLATGIVSLGPEFQSYFLARPDVSTARASGVDSKFLAQTIDQFSRTDTPANRFLSFASDASAVQILLVAYGQECKEPQVFNGWWVDRLLFKLNPKRNRRRQAVMLWECQAPAVALLGETRIAGY